MEPLFFILFFAGEANKPSNACKTKLKWKKTMAECILTKQCDPTICASIATLFPHICADKAISWTLTLLNGYHFGMHEAYPWGINWAQGKWAMNSGTSSQESPFTLGWVLSWPCPNIPASGKILSWNNMTCCQKKHQNGPKGSVRFCHTKGSAEENVVNQI